MDRRNFLAFIPTLSAIPFIGKDIVKTKSGILIADPVPHIKSVIITERINPMDLEVRLFSERKHIGNAVISYIEWDNPLETTCRDEPWAIREQTLKIQAYVINPNGLLKGMYGN